MNRRRVSACFLSTVLSYVKVNFIHCWKHSNSSIHVIHQGQERCSVFKICPVLQFYSRSYDWKKETGCTWMSLKDKSSEIQPCYRWLPVIEFTDICAAATGTNHANKPNQEPHIECNSRYIAAFHFLLETTSIYFCYIRFVTIPDYSWLFWFYHMPADHAPVFIIMFEKQTKNMSHSFACRAVLFSVIFLIRDIWGRVREVFLFFWVFLAVPFLILPNKKVSVSLVE